MDKESKTFLYDLLTTPSGSGYEQRIQEVVRRRMKPIADAMETDLHGNVMAVLNPKASRRVMLAGHCDQIALMVKHITEDGYIYFDSLGGIDVPALPGSLVTVHSKAGPIDGVIGKKPIHLQPPEERGKAVTDATKLWVDVGAKKKREVERRVEIGDFITFRLQVTELGNEIFSAPGLDDKVGVFVAMETLRLCAAAKLSVALFAVSTVQEEVGLRGARTAAYGIDPEVGIGIDVTHANDDPGNDSRKEPPCKLGGGPCISKGPNTNPVVHRMLVDAAKKAKVSYQLSPSSKPLGNDTNAIQVNRRGVATASIGIPNRYMHTQVEACSFKDLESSAKLLAQFIRSITAKTDFTPA